MLITVEGVPVGWLLKTLMLTISEVEWSVEPALKVAIWIDSIT